MALNIDLSKQEYPVFNIDSENGILNLGKKRNIIFGRNGTGKSTLCKLIKEQYSDKYGVHIFTGFDDLVVDNKMDALVLGKETKEAKENIERIERQLTKLYKQKEDLKKIEKSLMWDELYEEEDIEKHILYKKSEELENRVSKQKIKLDGFCRNQASSIKNKYPQITGLNYNINSFKDDIPRSKVLSETVLKENKLKYSEETKSIIGDNYSFPLFNFKEYLERINEILEHAVQTVVVIEELKDNAEKKNFAKQGLELHKAGDKCSFCGSVVEEERINKVKSLVSSEEVEIFQMQIEEEIKRVNENIKAIQEIRVIDNNDFYSIYQDEINEINSEIESKREIAEAFFESLKKVLEKKQSNLFQPLDKLKLAVPEEFLNLENLVSQIVEKHNQYTEKLDSIKDEAKEKLRLHYVAESLLKKEEYRKCWRGFEVEDAYLNQLEEELENVNNEVKEEIKKIWGSKEPLTEGTLYYIEYKVSELENHKNIIIENTKSTYEFVRILNEKLKSAGKTNLELDLVTDENGLEHYKIKDGNRHRPIDRISTGEKNIIAFLYFMERLGDVEKNHNKNKIIVFDDPMNSNDDAMQYLIITELQKLYNNDYPDKFNADQDDYFICLTHNAHFYLNLPNRMGRMRYDRFGLYRLENSEVIRVNSMEEDFKTHYESLWIELKAIYQNNLINTMLNVMRRIVETYTKFNRINEKDFYEGKEEHYKLFNVNSHSIDDLSAEFIGKEDRDVLLNMFRDLFEENNAITHFETFWSKD